MGGLCFADYKCQQCGITFRSKKRYNRIVRFCSQICYGDSKKGKAPWNLGVPMKEETKRLLSEQRKGKHISPKTEFSSKNHSKENNKRWKGGIQTLTSGYRLLLQPYHPRANVRGYVYEHILVAERYLGRFTTKDEVVHHINKNTGDNRPENLFLFPCHAEHMRHHQNLRSCKEQSKVSNLC